MTTRLDLAFEVLEAAAVKGDRCPKSRGPDAHPALQRSEVGALARAGRISVEIYPHNFRRVTILEGPHKLKSTAPAPNKNWKPYKVLP